MNLISNNFKLVNTSSDPVIHIYKVDFLETTPTTTSQGERDNPPQPAGGKASQDAGPTEGNRSRIGSTDETQSTINPDGAFDTY